MDHRRNLVGTLEPGTVVSCVSRQFTFEKKNLFQGRRMELCKEWPMSVHIIHLVCHLSCSFHFLAIGIPISVGNDGIHILFINFPFSTMGMASLREFFLTYVLFD